MFDKLIKKLKIKATELANYSFKDKFYLKIFSVDTSVGPRLRVDTHDSVSIMVFDSRSKKVLLVKQPRVAFISEDNPTGIVVETVAGRCDKPGKDALQLMVEETIQEAELEISRKDIILLNDGKPLVLSAGILSEKAFLALVVKPGILDGVDYKEGLGNKDEGEDITRIVVSLKELDQTAKDDLRVYAMLEALKVKLLEAELKKLTKVATG